MHRELTDEGKKMWDNLIAIEAQTAGTPIIPAIPKPKKERPNPYKIELDFIRLEIKKMIYNSTLVVEDCNFILEKFKTKEEYYLSDAKVAKTLHLRLIERYKNLLDGIPAFDHEIVLPAEYLDEQ